MKNIFIKTYTSIPTMLCIALSAFLLCSNFEVAASSKTVAKVSKSSKTKKKKGNITSVNTFIEPDFAYPKTVIANAEKEMKAAGSRKDYANVLLAAMQINIAETSISQSNASRNIAMYDSLGNVLPSPWNKLAYMLEAEAYSNIYNSARWQYDGRTLPSDSVPENVNEWSKELFNNKIISLMNKAEVCKYDNTPISEITKVLADNNFDSSVFPTVGAFISIKADKILEPFASRASGNVIPFFSTQLGGQKENEAKSIISRVTENLIQAGALSVHPGEECLGVIMKAKASSGNELDYVKEEYKKLKESEYSLWLLKYIIDKSNLNFADKDNDIKGIYAIAEEAVKRHEDSLYAIQIENTLKRLKSALVDVKFEGQYLFGNQLEGSVVMQNINSAYLLLFKAPNGDEHQLSKLLKTSNLVSKLAINSEGEVPFKSPEMNINLPAQDYGYYFVVASNTEDKRGVIDDNKYVNLIHVSDLGAFNIPNQHKQDENKVFVVSAGNGGPIANAGVTIEPNRSKWFSLKTNENGSFCPGKGYGKYTIRKNKDTFSDSYSSWIYSDTEPDTICGAQILTDLSLYHPGDSVGFTVIVWRQYDRNQRVAADKNVIVTLHDANYNKTDSLRLTTDKDGRAIGYIELPKNGLLGRYTLTAGEGKELWDSTNLTVAEYKAPTFFVELSREEAIYAVGDSIRVKGRVMTYSGMPVSDAKVNYEITYQSWWRWRQGNQPSAYGGELQTDGTGEFEIVLPTAGLKDTPYCCGSYLLNVTATSPAGETATASPARFALGAEYRIQPNISDKINLDSPELKLNVPVLDLMDRQIPAEVEYSITEKGAAAPIMRGKFTSPTLILRTSEIASGEYTFAFSIKDSETKTTTILWRKSDSRPPVETPLWVPEATYQADRNGKDVKVLYGSSYKDGNVYYEIASPDSVISSGWIKGGGKMSTISVPTPAANSRYKLLLASMYDLKQETAEVMILPSEADRELKISSVSMRDKIMAGAEEKWTFRIEDNYNHSTADLPVMAVLTDKALNAITPFHWYLDTRSNINYNISTGLEFDYISDINYRYNMSRNTFRTAGTLLYPEWKYMGNGLYYSYLSSSSRGRNVLYESAADGVLMETEVVEAQHAMNGVKVRGSSAKMRSVNKAGAMKEEPVTTDLESEADMESGSDVGPNDMEMSEMEHPLAFFYPNLSTNEKGEVELNFTVPNYNTTWQLQLAAYNKSLYSALATYDVVSSKPVMVKANVPRFLRTGDEVDLFATLYNNTDSVQAVGGRIELFNPITDEIIKSETFTSETVQAKGNRLISIKFTTPDNATLIGVRVMALGANHTDGEQMLISILPASSPVIESTPIYMEANVREFSMKLPSLDDKAQVTLQYCDNPIWYCVKALPDITTTDSKSVLAKVNALFGNAMAAHLLKKYPQIGNAISYWDELQRSGKDNPLVSELNKNQMLKVLPLEATTWVNDASSQTVIMQRLSELLNGENAINSSTSLLNEISKQQRNDGGWSWCEDFGESSMFITSEVLLNLAMLKQAGALEGYINVDGMIGKAVKYYDAELYKRYQKDKKHISTSSALSWLYVRSFFDVPYAHAGIRSMYAKGIRQIEGEWRQFDIYNKATSAILLHREGKKATASAITESLRQFATTTPERGMYFDNLDSGWNGFGRLITTTQVLEAFYTNNPDDNAIDALRQWLLLQKQTQDWGYNKHTAEVIWAILSTGSDWTEPASDSKLTISLGEKALEVNGDKYTGEVMLQLNANEASGQTLHISREGQSPAWGGVISQYMAKMEDIHSYSIPDLSIEKNVYVIKTDETGTEASAKGLKVGQKVRITLSITTARDLQYVAITDERPACMEPTQQLAGIETSDGIFMYYEPRESQTNLMINFLPKGTHVISYDCFVSQEGTFSQGIATVQSLYAPMITAHSAGKLIVSKSQSH